MRSQRTIEEKIEQQIFCFGGDPGGGPDSTTDSAYDPGNQQVGQGSPVNEAGQNTRTDSRGNTVNFNTGPASVGQKTGPDRVLPNGIVVEEYSTPFAGQVNLSNRGTPEVTDLSTNTNRGLYDNLAVNVPTVNVPNVNDLTAQERSLMDALNTPMGKPTTPQQAMDQALGLGEFGGGRMGLGGGFSVGNVPGGVGIGFDMNFAQGGAVTSGIGSLLRSTKT